MASARALKGASGPKWLALDPRGTQGATLKAALMYVNPHAAGIEITFRVLLAAESTIARCVPVSQLRGI